MADEITQLTGGDYDELIAHTDASLRRVYEFVDLPYRPDYGARINAESIAKATRLTAHQRRAIRAACLDVYEQAQRFA